MLSLLCKATCLLWPIFIVYQMGRLCGGAHEISGIKAQIFLRVGGWGGRVGGVIRLSF